jgi:flagella basal body P-ring formation protein FlgA
MSNNVDQIRARSIARGATIRVVASTKEEQVVARGATIRVVALTKEEQATTRGTTMSTKELEHQVKITNY